MKKNGMFLLAGLLATSVVVNAEAASLLGDWPTSYKNDDGYEVGLKGLYQYDTNQFSSIGRDPQTNQRLFVDDSAARLTELDGYVNTPWGLGAQVGYDWKSSWTDNYLKYKTPAIGTFRLGQLRTLVGWNEDQSANALTFLERAPVDSAIYEGHRLGADWNSGMLGAWLFELAYYTGGDLDGNNKGHGFAGRAVFAPVVSDTRVIHLGIAASREYRDDDVATISSSPAAGLTDTQIVDTGPLANSKAIDRLGVETGWMQGPYFLQAEYLQLRAERTAGHADFTGDGYYALASWMLTGESRAYKSSYFRNTQPTHDYGAFELAARYDELDLRDGAVAGGKEHEWSVGLNWYLGQHLKFQSNYIWVRADRSPANSYLRPVDPHILEVRAQLYF